MSDVIQCLRCRAPMEMGYIADAFDGGTATQERWSPGEPRTSFWTGLKLDRSQQIPVTTARCPKCGVLESYARPV